MRHILLALACLSVAVPAATGASWAQQYSARDEAVNARLLVAKFGRLCADPDATIEMFETRAREQSWSPASVKSVEGADLENAGYPVKAWRDRMNGVGGSNETVPYTPFVGSNVAGDLVMCGFGYERLSYEAMRAAMEASSLYFTPRAGQPEGDAVVFEIIGPSFNGYAQRGMIAASGESERKGVIWLARCDEDDLSDAACPGELGLSETEE